MSSRENSYLAELWAFAPLGPHTEERFVLPELEMLVRLPRQLKGYGPGAMARYGGVLRAWVWETPPGLDGGAYGSVPACACEWRACHHQRAALPQNQRRRAAATPTRVACPPSLPAAEPQRPTVRAGDTHVRGDPYAHGAHGSPGAGYGGLSGRAVPGTDAQTKCHKQPSQCERY